MKRAEGNYLMATHVRTTYANALFNPAVIAAVIDEVAGQGFRHLRIVQEFPFDISDTDAARALERWLDQEQFHYIWRPTYMEQDAFRPAQVNEYPELVIMW